MKQQSIIIKAGRSEVLHKIDHIHKNIYFNNMKERIVNYINLKYKIGSFLEILQFLKKEKFFYAC